MASIAKSAISLLENARPERLIAPNGGPRYRDAVTSPWSQTCWTEAAGYVQIKTVQELAQALAILKETKCKFSIRSSGHNPNSSFSNADETAVVLDISHLSAKELAQDGTARIGAGSTWGQTYAWLEEEGLSVIGGRQQEVGLGGFIVGGGLNALPNLHGLGADNVKNFEVLLADGQIVNANAEEHADLYRALKGGGADLGIVTRFDLRTYPLTKVQATINMYKPDDYVEIIKATIAVQEAMEKDPNIGLFTNFNKGFVAVGMIYADCPKQRPSAFEPFDKLGGLISPALPTTDGTLLSLCRAMSHEQARLNRSICTMTTKVSQDLYEEVYKAWVETCKTLPDGAILHYTIQPVGSVAAQKGKDNGGNVMGLQNVPQCWWVFTCEWPGEASSDDNDTAQRAIGTIMKQVESLAVERGLLLNYLCMSFAHASQKVLRSYGSENGAHIMEIARKYDPEGVFQELQLGGLLLRNSM